LNKHFEAVKKGIIDDNPVFAQAIGLCPVMAVTTSAVNGVAMGLAATIVLISSNVIISLLRKLIPEQVRIPIFIVVIAAFTSMVEMLLKAYFPAINAALGIYIPLIAVNCIIFSRSESFAYKNSIIDSAFDGIGMGLGFTAALTAIGIIREFLGVGAIFGFEIAFMPQTIAIILPPGGFIVMACIIAGINFIRERKVDGH